MGKKLWRRPSPAMAVAVMALVLAASGSAVAASKLVSGNSLIKVNSLSGNRLKTGSVTGKQIKASTLGVVPSAATAQTATTAQTAVTATTAESSPISKVTYVATTGTASSNTAATPVTAACPAGTAVVGGGASVANEYEAIVNDSYPAGKTGWTADFYAATPTAVTVTAICAPAAATTP